MIPKQATDPLLFKKMLCISYQPGDPQEVLQSRIHFVSFLLYIIPYGKYQIQIDLPFAQKRFRGAEGITNVVTLSAFRSSFGKDYGLMMADTPLAGLCSRAV